MAMLNYRPNPAQDTEAECRQAGWMYIEDWLEGKEVATDIDIDELLLTVAERGAQNDSTYIELIGKTLISACTNPDRQWMVLPLSSVIDKRVTIIPY